MANEYGTPVQPIDDHLDAAPQKNKSKNTILIVVIVLVVLCCCCVGGALLFYYVLGDKILQALDIQVWAPVLNTFL